MAGGRHRSQGRVIHQAFKGFLLSHDERGAIVAMKRRTPRMSATALARAIGRPIAAVEEFLASPEYACAVA